LRLPTRGGLYAWEFAKGKSEVNVRVEGRLTLNSLQQILRAALDGFGIAYLPGDLVQQHIVSGRLIQVLEDWCQPFSGYHLYYPSRRQHTRAFELLVDHLRWRG
jgi:DNA-binding transcriptional LysR family regulator